MRAGMADNQRHDGELLYHESMAVVDSCGVVCLDGSCNVWLDMCGWCMYGSVTGDGMAVDGVAYRSEASVYEWNLNLHGLARVHAPVCVCAREAWSKNGARLQPLEKAKLEA